MYTSKPQGDFRIIAVITKSRPDYAVVAVIMLLSTVTAAMVMMTTLRMVIIMRILRILSVIITNNTSTIPIFSFASIIIRK